MSRAAAKTKTAPTSRRRLNCRVSRKALIHAIADCTVCGKHWEDYLTAQKKAATHAKRTGHKVIIDLGYVAEYGG